MNAAAFDEHAYAMARELEDREATRLGLGVSDARRRLAARLGLPTGTLENLRRQRTKGVAAWIFHRLADAYRADCERQMRALANEVAQTAALVGSDHPAVGAAGALVRASDRAVPPVVALAPELNGEVDR